MEKKDFTILYVDDEEQNLFSFKAVFRREYKVLTAKSGDEGLELMLNNRVDLIITDQRMPKMTGIQFLEKIIPQYPDTIRMILTGFSDVEAIIGAINNGQVFRYITKPWDENELRMTIENARQLSELQFKNRQLICDLRVKVEEQEKTLKLFMKYVPEPVIEKALQSTEDTMLDGEQRNISVLFCDIRGFTPMSEEMSPKEVVSFLNDYYSIMTKVIRKSNGLVAQFVGDEIFAAFGAPVAINNCEQLSVFCALEMMHKLEDLNNKYKNKLNREIKMGIGINAGEVVAGNLGSEDRMDYSLTGDTVNTGKRIEMITKEMPNTILVSESVYSKTKELFQYKAMEPLFVKGKKEKLHVYQVLGRK
ncbi:MAG: response regulator [Calditrichae bacterium]|nr:response regulator [Calditrichota bacterium]MCB9057542.1 response regulator [Calditrichia bacterium]